MDISLKEAIQRVDLIFPVKFAKYIDVMDPIMILELSRLMKGCGFSLQPQAIFFGLLQASYCHKGSS